MDYLETALEQYLATQTGRLRFTRANPALLNSLLEILRATRNKAFRDRVEKGGVSRQALFSLHICFRQGLQSRTALYTTSVRSIEQVARLLQFWPRP